MRARGWVTEVTLQSQTVHHGLSHTWIDWRGGGVIEIDRTLHINLCMSVSGVANALSRCQLGAGLHGCIGLRAILAAALLLLALAYRHGLYFTPRHQSLQANIV